MRGAIFRTNFLLPHGVMYIYQQAKDAHMVSGVLALVGTYPA